ncbi:A24 family peptidase [Roseisolibacter sp. H3M3-2]|uniref:prepilin peptidase n=1 Tax=Roseisolibacter sp. H3M3-2 TaxID=3031323 RepID=UPI0023D9B44F|nr:A24 family peptidase [Roseisolibacter sp. H3M3-2]MDF1501901.1 prepilin peptidase [Roseisolibacter sp. H3M3-2]
MLEPHWSLAALAFLFGAVIGSFLNVCIVRWPEGESVVRPRSRCPRCGRPVQAFENVPILSWLLLRGKCRGCGLPISPLYPAIELTTGLGWLAAYAAYGATFDALRLAVFGTVLLGIAATDARRFLIPDGFTVFLLLWALGTSFLGSDSGSGIFATPYAAFFGACTGAGALAIIGWLGELALKKEAMGFGDVTMMAAVGAALGPERALLTVLVGAFVGAVASVSVIVPLTWVAHRRRLAGGETEAVFELPHIPFGVFLAPAALLTLLWGDRMIAWYFATVLQP